MKENYYKESIELLKNIVDNSKFKNKIYLVGGAVRDLVLGYEPKDIDLCIDLQDGSNKFIEFLKNSWTDKCKNFVTYPRYGTSKFTLILNSGGDVDIECVIPRMETYNNGPRKPDTINQCSIHEDSIRRDFCCNALYMNITTEEILDPTGKGISDCKDKILRTPLDPEDTFKDDPLRMLRAIRFSCTKGFKILPDVLRKIKPYPEYFKLSMERINDEFTKIIDSRKSVNGIRLLHSTGLLEHIIPELEESWGFDQNSIYHSMNLTEHTLSVLEKLDNNSIIRHRSPEDYIPLKLAGLLHDIAKYKIYQVKSDGHYSFKGHDIASSKMSENILTRLKYSNSVINLTSSLIKNHMCMKNLYDYDKKEYTGKTKTTMKLANLFGDHMDANLLLINADNMSHDPLYCMPLQTQSFKKEYKRLQEKYKISNIISSLPISGNDIMKFLNIGPGKRISQIKSILQDIMFEFPNLFTKEQLWGKYIKEYSGTFWVARELNGDWTVYLKEPIWSTKYNWFGQDPDNYDPCNQSDEIYPDDLFNENIEIKEKKNFSAYLYPKIYKRLIRNYKAREIIHNKSGIVLNQLETLEGFRKLELTLESHDLIANIYWVDGLVTSIM